MIRMSLSSKLCVKRTFAAFSTSAASCPPGIGRLGLSATDHRDLERVACHDGPGKALELLVSRGYLETDELQAQCAEHLSRVRDAAHNYGLDMQEWRRCYAAWLAAFRRRLRTARAQETNDVQVQANASSQGASKAIISDSSAKAEEPIMKLRARLVHLAGEPPPRPELQKQGLFIWGGVGRGKSLLMDLFVSSFGPSSSSLAIKRHHYHDFMNVVHQQLHKKRHIGMAKHALKAAAVELSGNCVAVLCLDEFQVTNIADAVILRGLFKTLFINGAVLVTTSNRPPEDLYKDGLNYLTYMPPFLQLLYNRINMHHLDSSVDYRVQRFQRETRITDAQEQASDNKLSGNGYSDFIVASAGTHELEVSFARAVKAATPMESTTSASSQDLLVSWGRKLKCQAVQAGVARFEFQELCGAPLGADDYMALIQKNSLHTFVVSDVPRFTLQQHNEARRFTNFIDCLYEGQCRLICTAEAPPEELLCEMEILSDVAVEPKPAVDLATVVRSTRRHGDISFDVSAMSPCRPDTFATAEADAEAGTGSGDILEAVRAAKRAANARSGKPLAVDVADPTEQDGIAGVTSAAIVSLQESGFAARRCVSRLQEMSTDAYHNAHRLTWALASRTD